MALKSRAAGGSCTCNFNQCSRDRQVDITRAIPAGGCTCKAVAHPFRNVGQGRWELQVQGQGGVFFTFASTMARKFYVIIFFNLIRPFYV